MSELFDDAYGRRIPDRVAILEAKIDKLGQTLLTVLGPPPGAIAILDERQAKLDERVEALEARVQDVEEQV